MHVYTYIYVTMQMYCPLTLCLSGDGQGPFHSFTYQIGWERVALRVLQNLFDQWIFEYGKLRVAPNDPIESTAQPH